MKSPLLWLVMVCVASRPVWAIQCGDILGPGGTYTLTADRDCCVQEELRVIVRDAATLDLQGYTIAGVALDGTEAQLRNGQVGKCSGSNFGVFVEGTGSHRLEDLFVGFIDGPAIAVSSDRDILSRVTTSADSGVVLDGHHNVIVDSAFTFALIGIEIYGQQNRVSRNEMESTILGVLLEGDHNLVSRNQISAGIGLQVSGEGNVLIGNTSHSELDAEDTHGDCTHNLWLANNFETADPPCILEGPLAVSQQ